MTNEVYASLAYQKLIEFKSQIVNGIATKDVFELCKDLMDLLKTTPGQAFGMSVIFRDFLHPIYTEIDIMDKTKIFGGMFNDIIIELLKSIKKTDEDAMLNLVIPFVNEFIYYGLNECTLRGLVHKLEETGMYQVKDIYDIGTKYQIYPYQDMESGSTIILRTHYSFFEMRVILNEVLKEIVKVISIDEIARLYEDFVDSGTTTGLDQIRYRIRLEKLSNPGKTHLPFLDRLDLATLKQASERFSQVLESYDTTSKIKLLKNRSKEVKGGLMTLQIDSASLIEFLYCEHIAE